MIFDFRLLPGIGEVWSSRVFWEHEITGSNPVSPTKIENIPGTNLRKKNPLYFYSG
ncbi:hypothetical protein phi1422_0025 [Bdellovibrio phage phi1422]|uniref:hypothetical protein n=1 Tax=Bdellovibrio phage phi1422 TaxID=1127515 RepID=UPI0002536D4D|nr:hypothetical protein F395_gp25 [Bdellovibrio phage phi1422]AFC22545.1 hypothetical protein phi1422_0025 [Bdellovibrio phage phi1422]